MPVNRRNPAERRCQPQKIVLNQFGKMWVTTALFKQSRFNNVNVITMIP
jgi:hypothetical protein